MSLDPRAVLRMVEAWSPGGDDLAAKSRELVRSLLECTDQPFSRDQYAPGHITATALVLHPQQKRFLVVFHRRLQRWLLPGGHVEPEDADTGHTARREAVEETGVALTGDEPVLVGMDVHGIPGNQREPYHLHHDLVFALRASGEAIKPNGENRAVAWCSPEDVGRYALPPNVLRCLGRAR